MADQIDQLKDFLLNNITWLIFLVFMLSGLFTSGKKKESEQGQSRREAQPRRDQPQRQGRAADNRPFAERMAEAFGMQELMDEVRREQQNQQRGRRSTTTGNVQDNYPELFGGSSMFQDRDQEWGMGKTKWGFDETEWGTTFEKNDEEWGSAFGERKSSEPRIEWPS